MANTLRIMDVAPDALPQVKKAKSKNIKEAKTKDASKKKLSAVVESGDNT